MRRIGLALAVLLAVLACKSPPPPEPVEVAPEPMPTEEWVRVDKSPANPNELARDEAICEAAPFERGSCSGWGCAGHQARVKERHRRSIAGCMAERGWIRVLE